MNALTAWLERYILPIAAKIGGQKHLVALRDAFIGTMPATMAGSIAVMINAIIRDLPKEFIDGYDGTTIPVIKEIININGFVWNGTIAIAGLIFAFSWGYNLAKAYNVNVLAGGIVSLAALIQGISFGPSSTADLGMKIPEKIATAITGSGIGASVTPDGELSVGLWGWLNLNHLNGNAFFTAMIIGAVSVIIFAKLMQKNVTIKLPDSVPPAVSSAFAAIIPATVALYVVAIFNFAFGQLTGQLFIDWIQETIAKPLMGFTQGLGAILVIQLAIQIFWFFGIHGTNVMAPVLEGIFGQGQLINIDIYQKGYNGLEGRAAVLEAIKDGKAFMWVRGSFDIFSMFGGSGGTITLILAILLFSKRADYLTIGKLSLGPGIFNINEPIMFGLPIVLNAIMFIPFILAPIVATTIGYLATLWGWVAPVTQSVTWVVPPGLLAFLATGADWRAPIVSLVCMAATFVIWVPFVIAANKMDPSLGENDN